MTKIGMPAKKKGMKLWSRVLAGILLLSFLAVASSWGATQFLAMKFNYSSALGDPLSGKIYPPFSWVQWFFKWRYDYIELSQQAALICAFLFAFPLGTFAFVKVAVRKRSKGIEGLHGTARWANVDEIVKAGLLPADGESQGTVYVGAYKDKDKTRYLTHDGAEHILAVAPTRSGKGVGLVLPTLLSWMGSVLCYDIKGENWALTAGWRRQYANNLVMKFDPASDDGSSVKFNPLSEIRLNTNNDVSDAQNIAMMIVDPDGKGLDDHWAKTGYGLLVATILHVSYVKNANSETANLTDVGMVLADPNRAIEELFEEMLEFPHKDGITHPVVAQEARGMIQKADKEQSGVVSTVRSNLTIYLDPIVSKNIASSDFKISDLMNHEKPISLYLVVKPRDAERMRPLIRLLITQVVQTLTDSMEYENGKSVAHYKHRLLMMLDEFASLKKLTAIENGLAFMAGYGIKAYLIVQDLEQINNAYGQFEGLLGNCHIKVAYAPNKLKTAETLSKMTGISTVIKKQSTVSGSRHQSYMNKVSETYSEVSRPLLTVDEVMKLPGSIKEGSEVVSSGDMLIFMAGFPAIYGTQILYFLDPVFSERAKVPTPQTSDMAILPNQSIPFV